MFNQQASVYLDNAATTPVDPAVAAAMADCLTLDGTFANPASHTHHWGLAAADAVEQARAEVSKLVGAQIRRYRGKQPRHTRCCPAPRDRPHDLGSYRTQSRAWSAQCVEKARLAHW